MMRTNYEGTVHIVHATLSAMLEKEAGDIIIVTSAAGFRGGPTEAIYAGIEHA